MAKNDDKIKTLLAKVEEQKAGLGKAPKAAYDTNAVFKYRDGSFVNLNTVRDPQPLVEALAYLLEKEQLHTAAAERLGVPVKEFIWDGHPVSEWEGDFKKRIEVFKWEQKKAQLEETKKKLKALVSEEAKTEMELSNIEALLG